MKLHTFFTENNSTLCLGVKTDKGVVDIATAAASLGETTVPTTMAEVIDNPVDAGARLKEFMTQITDQEGAAWWLTEKNLRIGPCVINPEKIICIGLNYKRHALESGMAVPEDPVVFSKFNNTLAGTGEFVPLPESAVEYDYEVELGVVMGKEARNVSTIDALDYVLGYCTVNDLSARDLQMRTSQWLLGKTLDKFMPAGPYLVTADEVENPQDLWLRCWVNGELRQDSNTSDMVFSVAEIISFISQFMTLKPGDLISTGTPEGVVFGIGTKDWLKPGDEVVVEVEKLGRLTNVMVSA